MSAKTCYNYIMKSKRDPQTIAFFRLYAGTEASTTCPTTTQPTQPMEHNVYKKAAEARAAEARAAEAQAAEAQAAEAQAAEAQAALRTQITNARNANRKELLRKASALGVGVVHIFDEYYPKGGMTVAFHNDSPTGTGRMVEVAVAVCSPEDSFSRKIGTELALEAFFNERTIVLPLYNKHNSNNLSTQVKRAFEDMGFA